MMVRASAKGSIDFSRSDPLDRNWWRHVHWMLREQRSQELMQRTELELQVTLGMLGYRRLSDEAATGYLEMADELRIDLHKRIEPWQEDIVPKDHAEVRRDAYAEAFGDPESDAHKEAEARLLAQIEHNLRNPPSVRS